MAKRPRNRQTAAPKAPGSSLKAYGFQTRAYYSPSKLVRTTQGDTVRVLDPDKAGLVLRHDYRRKPVETGGLHYHKPPRQRVGKVRGPEYTRLKAEQEELAWRLNLAERAKQARADEKAKAEGKAALEGITQGSMSPKRQAAVRAGFEKAGMAHLIK